MSDTLKGLTLIAAFIALLATFAVWVGMCVQQSSPLEQTSTMHV